MGDRALDPRERVYPNRRYIVRWTGTVSQDPGDLSMPFGILKGPNIKPGASGRDFDFGVHVYFGYFGTPPFMFGAGGTDVPPRTAIELASKTVRSYVTRSGGEIVAPTLRVLESSEAIPPVERLRELPQGGQGTAAHSILKSAQAWIRYNGGWVPRMWSSAFATSMAKQASGLDRPRANTGMLVFGSIALGGIALWWVTRRPPTAIADTATRTGPVRKRT